ncbi:HAD family hydrolase [Kitasatospora sp. NBC_01287]|uniref:HAD family hydrolase n=1 Tax=Kitasatospora sp. NBC_01287 TaxID=2903573 RepID=UPI002259DD81|nr:HAD family hydrolase [Kitasatospora sp. NBC_01287]MCX4749967.1 HAD family hydrolase [Kitasatospora sp. NBC_01287]
MTQRLALFDLDNTLLDRDAAFARWAAGFAAEHRLDEAAHSWLLRQDAAHRGPRGGYFQAVHARFGLGGSADELWAGYRRRMPELVACRPADLAALAELRAAGWRTAIVTNGRTDNQQAKIRRTGLADLVDAWCVSEREGLRKPDPALFALAARRCGADPAAGGWMTGDSAEDDIAGGRAAGLRTVWIHRGRPWPAASAATAPDHAVERVADAVRLLLARA